MGIWYQKFCKGHTDYTISETKFDRTPIEAVKGKNPEISEYMDFDFYDLLQYHTEKNPRMINDNQYLGRWMGVTCRIGRNVSYRIMPISGQPIEETNVQHVTCNDILNQDIAAQIIAFYQALT